VTQRDVRPYSERVATTHIRRRQVRHIIVPVTPREYEYVFEVADREERQPGAHLRFLLRDFLAGAEQSPERDVVITAA